jgi:hypothetical protein
MGVYRAIYTLEKLCKRERLAKCNSNTIEQVCGRTNVRIHDVTGTIIVKIQVYGECYRVGVRVSRDTSLPQAFDKLVHAI